MLNNPRKAFADSLKKEIPAVEPAAPSRVGEVTVVDKEGNTKKQALPTQKRGAEVFAAQDKFNKANDFLKAKIKQQLGIPADQNIPKEVEVSADDIRKIISGTKHADYFNNLEYLTKNTKAIGKAIYGSNEKEGDAPSIDVHQIKWGPLLRDYKFDNDPYAGITNVTPFEGKENILKKMNIKTIPADSAKIRSNFIKSIGDK